MHFGPRYAGQYEALINEARTAFPRVSADLRFAPISPLSPASGARGRG